MQKRNTFKKNAIQALNANESKQSIKKQRISQIRITTTHLILVWKLLKIAIKLYKSIPPDVLDLLQQIFTGIFS